MFDDFTDKERDLSVVMMEQWGKFIKQQTVDWGQHPHHAYFDLNGLTEIEQEAHSHRFLLEREYAEQLEPDGDQRRSKVPLGFKKRSSSVRVSLSR